MRRFLLMLLVLVLLPFTAKADIKVNLLDRLNTKLSDESNLMLDSVSKYKMLDEVAREMARRGVYLKRDTILTADSTEYYAGLNSDYAGTIESAYIKNEFDRKFLPIIDRDSALNVPDVKEGVLTYIWWEQDTTLGVHAIPRRVDTIILRYYAYPPSLSDGGDSLEWSLPDGLEGAALELTAAKCWMTADLRPDMAALYFQRFKDAMAREEGVLAGEAQE